MRTPFLPIPALATALALAVAGCGGDDEPDEPTTTRAGDESLELIDSLPRTDPPAYVFLDVVAAKEALDIDPGADPIGAMFSGSPAERRLGFLVGTAVPIYNNPRVIPVAEAIDTAAITAAANNGAIVGPSGVTVIATEQPFDGIASALQEEGYTREGDVLNTDTPSFLDGASVVAGGDGVVALGFDQAAVEAAAQGDGGGPAGRIREFAEETDAPAVAAVEVGDECVQALAIVDELRGGTGELVVVSDDPDPEHLRADEETGLLLDRIEFADPEVEGDELVTRFTYPIDQPVPSPLALVGSDLPLGAIYSCD